MKQEPYLLKMTGTIRKNKKEIPAEMRVAAKEPPASKFCHTNDLTLVSYSPKKNKIVLLVIFFQKFITFSVFNIFT